MPHLPDGIHSAIDTSELGAIIAEHRNALLCELLRPMLDTFDREGIPFSSVLGALGTIANERGAIAPAPTNGGTPPWERCYKALQQARCAAEDGERSRGRGTVKLAPPVARVPASLPYPIIDTIEPEPVNEEDAWTRELINEA